MAVVELPPERIEVMATPSAAALLRRAADSMGRGVAEFLLDAAVEAATDVAGDRPPIRLDAERWLAFKNALDRPVADKPRLTRLLTGKSVLE